MPFAIFLASMVPSIIGKIFLALGVGMVTITGVDFVFGELESLLVAKLGGVVGIGAGLLGLAGAGDAIGYIVGAMTARVALTALINSARLISK